MTIRARLYLAVILLAGAVAVGSAFSVLLLRTADHQLETVRNKAIRPIVQLGAVKDAFQADIVDTAVKVRNGLVSWEVAASTIDEARGRIDITWDSYRIDIEEDDELRRAGDLDQRIAKAEAAISQLRAAIAARDIPAIGRFVDEVMYPTIDPITTRLGSLIEYKIIASNRVLRQAGGTLHDFQGGLAIVLALVALAAAFGIWVTRYKVSLPLAHMTQAMTAVAGGDLDHKIPGTGKRDEIGQLARALAVFRDAGRALREAQQQAEAATRAKSDFLATMSHEIRTPMNGVMSMAEMLELTRLDSDQHRMAKVIRESAGALLTVINDILDFSKIEAGKLDIESIPFSVGDLVDGVGELLATRADDKGLDLIIEIGPRLLDRKIGDPTRVRQVLLNLGGNAIKFTEHGHVHIAVLRSADDSALRFEVRDSGIGLTEEQCAKLFKPFMQADSSTARKFGGTGLGLSICHRLCEMMGGRIGVTSVFGQGSVFWFELPLPAEDGSAPPAPGQDIAEDIKAKRVLLVGLPDAAAQVATRYLDAAGIVVAGSVADLEAAEAIDKGSYDIALVDARSSGNIVRDSTERLDASVPRILLAARSLVSTLDAVARSSFRATLTYPLNRSSLWRAVAIACGLAPADSGHETMREDMAFAPPEADVAAAGQALILVAEDNPTNQMVIRQMLSRMGFACEIAKDGAVALKLYDAARERYGLLLTDFHMPEMDGFALTAAVREREQQHGDRIPIIALTADALSGTEEKCLEAGMDGYLTKPIDSRRLGQMLAHWLPQALPLRRVASAMEVVKTAAPASAGAAWDKDIFDPARLAESFGSFDATAKGFLQDFVADAETRVAEILKLQDGSDLHALRHIAHALKGGALTVGATRLGMLAADLQDACDAADAETAQLMAELMPATLDELKTTLPLILKA